MIHLIKSKPVLVVFFHIAFVAILYVLLYHFKKIVQLPDDSNLTNWDAHWYESIKNDGYHYVPNQICNMAFFPLFPSLWTVTQLSAFYISIFNLAVFIISFALLIKQENLGRTFSLFILSTASFIFFALPYSESIFFLCGTLLLSGYHKKSRLLKILGFFLASLTRSVSLLFLPAIILTFLMTPRERDDYPKRRAIIDVFCSCLASVLGFLITAFIQYYETGKWFYFLGIQKFWKRHWIIPAVPFTTYDPQRVLGIDGASFIIGCIAIVQCCKWFITMVRKRKFRGSDMVPDSKVVFSSLIIAGTTALDVFFTFNDNGSTSIWSINRHLLCTPFSILFLHWLYQKFNPGSREMILITMMIVTGTYLTGVYQYASMLVFYLSFFLLLFLIKYRSEVNYSFGMIGIIYLWFVIIQVGFYYDFLLYKWIG
jgi:hypothetical protein